MLPKSGDDTALSTGNGSFYYLVDTLNLTAGTNGSGNLQSSPVYFVYSGGAWNEGFGDVGGFGSYWSSVVYNGGSAYGLNFNVNDNLGPQTNVNRGNGVSVRCVLR